MIEFKISLFQMISISLFGFIFGILELVTNGFYLLTKNKDLPRRQHSKELPKLPTENQIYHKVKQMFVLGIFLIFIASISLIIAPQLFIIGAVGILISGLIDYSKFRKKDMLILWCLISFIAGFFSLISHI